MANLINLEQFLKEYHQDPEKTKYEMVLKVMADIQDDIDSEYYKDIPKELSEPDYSRICKNLGWPDFQDAGLFEQCIDTACDTMLGIYGYKPLNYLNRDKFMREKYSTKE